MKYVLLALPSLAALAVPLYNLDDPRLFGIPFFYCAMFVQVPLSALFVYLAFRIDVAAGEA